MMNCLFFSSDIAIAEKIQGLGFQILARKSDGKTLRDANVDANDLLLSSVDLSTVSVVYADRTSIDPKDVDSIHLIRFDD